MAGFLKAFGKELGEWGKELKKEGGAWGEAAGSYAKESAGLRYKTNKKKKSKIKKRR